MRARQLLLPTLGAACLALAACGDARPAKLEESSGLCVSCHGGVDNRTGAPPADTRGATATAGRGVGAHTAHVQAGPMAGAFGCGECHEPVAEVGSPGHMNGAVDLPFGALSRTGGASPTWNPAAPAGPSCSSVYCHGARLRGGTNNEPVWTKVDGTQAACGTCHWSAAVLAASPVGHVALAPGSTEATCNACHPQTVTPAGTIAVAAGKHVNGVADVLADAQHPPDWFDQASPSFHGLVAEQRGIDTCKSCHALSPPASVTTVVCSRCHDGAVLPSLASCTTCHGGVDNSTGAPPKATLLAGSAAEQTLRTGAHTSHVAGTHGLSSPVACGECHVVPAAVDSPGHVDQPTATLTFGALATAGGAAPSWDRAAATCSASYCHGSFPNGNAAAQPVWTTLGGTFRSCTACHGAPPDTGHHYRHVFVEGRNCNDCHQGIAAGSGASAPIANGTITGPGLHVNGVKNVVLSTGRTWNGTGWYTGCGAGVCH